MCFYFLVLSQVNGKVLPQLKKVSGSGICVRGGELADYKTAYYYRIAYDSYFAGIYDTALARHQYGADVASDTYDAKLGANTADGFLFRSSTGTLIEDAETLKGLWTFTLNPLPISVRLPSTFTMYGHQVCENVDGGLTEVCARQTVIHKKEEEEHVIEVDNMTFCLTFTEDYKMKKFLEIAPDVAWKTNVDGYTHKLCLVGDCGGQGEGKSVIS